MGVNKVVYAKKVLIDLTSDNVDAASLRSGRIAHAASGSRITGTAIVADGVKMLFRNLTVPTSAWVNDGTYWDYPYRARITASGSTESMWPDVLFSAASISALESNQIAVPYARSNSGSVDIFASAKPSGNIVIDYLILR